MAILHTCPNLEVEIVVDGIALQEYDDDEEEEAEEEQRSAHTVTKYVEVRSDSEFAIRTKISGPLPAPKFSKGVFLDEVQVRSTFYKWYTFDDQLLQEGRPSQVGEQAVCQKFRFRNMAIGRSAFTTNDWTEC